MHKRTCNWLAAAASIALVMPFHGRAASYEFVDGYNVLDTNNAPTIGTNYAATAGLERDIAVDAARGIIYMARGLTTTADRPGGVIGIAAIVVTNGARAGSNFRDTGLITNPNGWCQSLAYDAVSDRLWVLGGPLGTSPIIYYAPGGTLGGAPSGDNPAAANNALVQAFRVDTNLLDIGVYVSPEVSTNGTPSRGGAPRGFAVRTVNGITTVYLGMGNHVQAWSNDQPVQGTNSPWRRVWATLRPPTGNLTTSRVALTGFNGVNGLAVDDAGNCYFSVQTTGGRIWTVRPELVQSVSDPLSLDYNDLAFGGASERDIIPLIFSASAGANLVTPPQAITYCRFENQKNLFVSFLPATAQRGITRLEIPDGFSFTNGGAYLAARAIDGFGSGQPLGGQDFILSSMRLKQASVGQPQGTSNGLLYHDVDSVTNPTYIYAVAFVTNTTIGQTLPTAAIIKARITSSTNPPVIKAQPTPQTLLEGGRIALSVDADGLAPLHYQWQVGMMDIENATNRTFSISPASTNDTALYRVIVSNALDFVVSTQVQVTVNPLVRSEAMTAPSWSLAPGSRPYITSDNTQRGLAYNPATASLLVVSRASSNSIHALNTEDGSELYFLRVAGLTGGTLPINMIGASDDGAVYVCNLAQNTEPFRIYRWGSEDTTTDPTVAFSAPANSLGAARWGDSFDVRGSALDNSLQIIAGSRASDRVTIFTTSDGGITLNTNLIRVPGASNGSFGLSVSFGAGNTFWGKGDGSTDLLWVQFDLANGTGVVLRAFGPGSYPLSATVMGFDTNRHLLAAISLENPDNLRLYHVPDPLSDPRLVDQELFPTDNDNGNATGAIDFGTDKVFALDSNNGIVAYTLGEIPAGPPGRLTITRDGNSVTLTWAGSFILQSASGVTNAFTDVMGASSGYSENMSTATEKYFRLRN